MSHQMEAGSLLLLQGQIKRDAEGYNEEFMLQYRHYRTSLAIFALKPHAEAKEFGDLVMFIAQVAHCYPQDTAKFPAEIMELLETQSTLLNSNLRRHLVQALILLRNRQVTPVPVPVPVAVPETWSFPVVLS